MHWLGLDPSVGIDIFDKRRSFKVWFRRALLLLIAYVPLMSSAINHWLFQYIAVPGLTLIGAATPSLLISA